MLNKIIIRLCLLLAISNIALANDIAAIERYLNSLHNVSADFVQTDNQDNQQKGKFFLSRPGKMRWQYEVPKKILIIISNKDLVHFDQQLDQVSYFKNREDFLSLLSQKNIKLSSGEITVDKIVNNGKEIKILLNKKNYSGSIMLIFKQTPLVLSGLEIIDESHNKVIIDFINFTEVPKLDDKLFIFHSHKLSRPKK
jgi:outer membrane lipoprotein carrier protein